MGSARLPGKVMMDIGGWPMIEHVLIRADLIPNVDQVVLAVPDEVGSDEPEAVAERMGFDVFRGSEDDVLNRYARAAHEHNADVICRITGDCPLLDPAIAALVIAPVRAGQAEYCSNVHPRSWEKGLDVEAFTRWALTVADRDGKRQEDREHVTPFIIDNPVFRQINVSAPEPHDINLNWSVDTEEDLERVRAEFEKRYPYDKVPSGSDGA